MFCGSSPITREHIFPIWLNRYLPEDRVQHLEQTRYGDDGFDRQRRSIGLDFTVRKVCPGCNNEWMSRLETDTIPVLHPLISNLEVQLLTTTQQRKVALWAVKTSMMLDQTQTVPLLSPLQVARLRTHRAIPGGTRIWIGACDAIYPLVTSHTVKIELEPKEDPSARPRPDGLFTPMKIGHLCLYVYFPGSDVVVVPPPTYTPALAGIWQRRGVIRWPPPMRPRTGGEFEEFADRFWRNLQIMTQEAAAEQSVREW